MIPTGVKTVKIAKRTVVTTKNTPLRSQCSSRSRQLKSIPKSVPFSTSMTTNKGCFKVAYGGKSGWIAKSAVKTITDKRVSSRIVSVRRATPMKAYCADRSVKLVKAVAKETALTTSMTTNVGCYKVKVSGKTGWVAKKDVSVISEKSLSLTAVRTNTSVPMWSVCSSKAARVKTVPKGTALVTTVTTNLGCYKISYGGKVGWIAKSGTTKVSYPKFKNPTTSGKLTWSGSRMVDISSAVSAHRGGKDGGAQSIEAFTNTLDSGVTDLEFDIRFSADRVPVVSHDPTPSWATQDQKDRKVTIDKVMCGENQGTAEEPEYDEPMCRLTFHDLVNLAKTYPLTHSESRRLILRAESKNAPGQSMEGRERDAAELANLIKDSGLVDHFVEAAFSFDKIPAIKKVAPTLEVQALVTNPTPATIVQAARAGADDYSYSASPGHGGNRWINELAHRQTTLYGKRPMTVTTWWGSEGFNPPVFAQQLSQGANKIIVDWPDRMEQTISASTCAPTWKDTRNLGVLTKTLNPGGTANTRSVLGFDKGLPTSSGLENVTIRVTSSQALRTGDLVITPAESEDRRDRAVLQQTGAGTWESAVAVSRSGKINVRLGGRVASTLTVTVTGYTENVCRVASVR